MKLSDHLAVIDLVEQRRALQLVLTNLEKVNPNARFGSFWAGYYSRRESDRDESFNLHPGSTPSVEKDANDIIGAMRAAGVAAVLRCIASINGRLDELGVTVDV